MIVENPEFTFNGNLRTCLHCPWDGSNCQGHKCPTKDTYKDTAASAMREIHS